MTSDTPRKGLPSAWHNAGLSFLSAFANLISAICSTSLMQPGTRNRSDPPPFLLISFVCKARWGPLGKVCSGEHVSSGDSISLCCCVSF